MKIGVISDTHIPFVVKEIPSSVLTAFKKIDLIVHAGDYTELKVIKKLKELNNFMGVYGNMDPENIREIIPKKDVLEVGKFKIGIIHGHGAPQGLEARVRAEFHEKLDVIIYGHSHLTKNEIIDDILFFNPGSSTDENFAPFKSFGILTIEESITGEIVRI